MTQKTLRKTKAKHRNNARKWGINKLKSHGVFSINSKPISSSKNTEIEKEFLSNFGIGLSFSYTEEMKKRTKSLKEDIGFVYFIGNYNFGFVKIGYSKCPERRIKEIQTGCPFSVCILGKLAGTPSYEKELHKKFQCERTNGEWFKVSEEIKKIISLAQNKQDSYL